MAAALCRVASLSRALRRGQAPANYIGEAIEGSAVVALQTVLGWTELLPGSSARQVNARIRACLGYGDRALLGSLHLGPVVESARRTVVEI